MRDFPGGITARALRFIPLSYVGQPCMRIEICGASKLLHLSIDNSIKFP
jgi:hypothetical protein